jgi:hypothetical protein
VLIFLSMFALLRSENKYTADNLQKLTNNMCYQVRSLFSFLAASSSLPRCADEALLLPSSLNQFARATRSVSLVPACYYADIICTQARPMVYDLDALDSSTVASGSYGGGGGSSRLAFDPMKVQRRIDTSPAFKAVQWCVEFCLC